MNKCVTARWRSLLTGLALIALAMSQSEMVRAAEASEGPLKIFSVKPNDFKEQQTGKGSYASAIPMQVPGMTGGIVRFVKGKNKVQGWTYWYPEVVYVVRGKGRLTATAPPFTAPHTYDVGVGDFFFIPPSTEMSFEALSDEPFEVFNAVPTAQ